MTMPTNPAVSVICAAYNGVKWLPETLRSLNCQTFEDFEVVLVDDASTDETYQQLTDAAAIDKRLKVFRNSANRRLVYTRNAAAAHARGRYIAVTDQDDLSAKSRLERQIAYLDSHPEASAVYVRVVWIDGEGKRIAGAPDWDYHGDQARIALVFHNFVAHSSLMFRRTAVGTPIYVPRFPLCEDYWLMVRLADIGKGLSVIRDRLVYYRQHESNYTKETLGEMKSLSRDLRRELLLRLEISATDDEMTVHDCFEAGDFTPTPHLHESCRQWLLHLRDSNSRTQYVSDSDFAAVASDKWLELSHKFSHLGPVAWETYRRGIHDNLRFRHRASVANLWLKCNVFAKKNNAGSR